MRSPHKPVVRPVIGSLALVGSMMLALMSSAAHTVSFQSSTADSTISAERIMRHVRYLSSDELQGRRAGTRYADKAADYIAEQFKSYGLKPGARETFLKPFAFVAGVKTGDSNRFEVNTGSDSRTLKLGEEFMPLAFSSPGVARGGVVFAGFGISAPELQYDSYAGADVKGKIVLVLKGSPDGDNPHGRFAEFTRPGLEIQNKTLKAREKGAAGVVFLSTEPSFKGDRLSRLQHDLNFLDAGIPAAVISKDAGDRIFAANDSSLAAMLDGAKAAGRAVALKTTALFKSDVIKIEGRSSNVVGVIEGSDPQLSSQAIVIGAHYDHLGLGGPESLAANPEGQIHHGADDNASGTAGLLELARTLTLERKNLKRSVVLVAFCGEELGLLGSAAYTKDPTAPLDSTIAMLNMDMIGRLRNNSLFVGGVGTSPAWKPMLESINSQSGGGAQQFQLSFGQDGFGPSDHQSFYVRDIPVLFFFTGSHDDYHKPTDTAEKINAEGAARVATLVGRIAESIAAAPERIAFTKVKVESRPTGRGFRVYLGTVPNYSDQSDGMKLDGVRPSSPAERAGLRAGDIITRIGKTPVKNVYDYTYALGEMTAGEEVEVAIRRDGRELTLKIVPDKRQ